MKLIYQGVPGAYSNLACFKLKNLIEEEITDISGMSDFKSVWESINNENIGVLPIENSYAGTIHENLYNFLRYDYKIIGEIDLKINHCLLSKEEKIENIKYVYSHPQALDQCHDYLKKNKIKAKIFSDTAGAAEMIVLKNEDGIGAIASSLAGDIYGLNILDEAIQDQDGNTTKFFLIAPKESQIKIKNQKGKTSIIFETKDIPSALYNCLGVFAQNNINLTKIESMPSLKNPFTYIFWINFEGTIENPIIYSALNQLKIFTNNIKILGEY